MSDARLFHCYVYFNSHFNTIFVADSLWAIARIKILAVKPIFTAIVLYLSTFLRMSLKTTTNLSKTTVLTAFIVTIADLMQAK